MVEYQGGRRLVNIYILGGLAGGLLFLLVYNLVHLIDPDNHYFFIGAYLLGASAGVLAVVFATATLLPEHSIGLLFLGRIKLKYIALGALVLTTLLDLADNTGGKIAHIGGALFGYFYIRQLQQGKDWGRWLDKITDTVSNIKTPRPKMKVMHRKRKTDEEYNWNKQQEQQKIDEILDKISKSGYESLTPQEKEFLFKVSNNKDGSSS